MDTPQQSIALAGLNNKERLVIAFETVNALGWRIRFTSDAGVIAYTSNGEFAWNGEVTVKLEEDIAIVTCVPISQTFNDATHCSQAIEQYVATYNKLRVKFTPDEVKERYREYEKDFLPPYEDTLKPDTRPKINPLTSFWSFFKPTNNYFFTPILACINILIFLIMICNGISVFNPNGQSMLAWGANSTIATLNGQWWRLLSNCFIHFGIMHLALNMYALVFVGMLLEPFLGKTKFLIAYLLTGIIASLASLWWHDYTISAGASGAVFGLYGVFLAILTTNHIERTMRQGLLINIGLFVVYNLVYGGLKSGIDNAAHLGGLLSGVLIGYLFVPALRKPNNQKVELTVLALTLVLTLAGSVITYQYLAKSDRVIYFNRMESFYQLEEKAVKVMQNLESQPDAVVLQALERGITYWQQGLNLLQQLNKLKLTDTIHSRNEKLIRYCRLRIQSYELMRSSANREKLERLNQQIKTTMDELSAR